MVKDVIATYVEEEISTSIQVGDIDLSSIGMKFFLETCEE